MSVSVPISLRHLLFYICCFCSITNNLEVATAPTYTIAAFGMTGAGKSTLLNVLSYEQANFQTSDKIYSCTSKTQEFTYFLEDKGINVKLIDTMGFGDNKKGFQPFNQTLALMNDVIDGVNMALIVVSIVNLRLSESEILNIEAALSILGQHATDNQNDQKLLEHVFIVLTQGNRLSENDRKLALQQYQRELFDLLASYEVYIPKTQILICDANNYGQFRTQVESMILEQDKYIPSYGEFLKQINTQIQNGVLTVDKGTLILQKKYPNMFAKIEQNRIALLEAIEREHQNKIEIAALKKKQEKLQEEKNKQQEFLKAKEEENWRLKQIIRETEKEDQWPKLLLGLFGLGVQAYDIHSRGGRQMDYTSKYGFGVPQSFSINWEKSF